MKANEFIKKYGLAEAKNILHGMDDASEFTAHMQGDTWDKPTLIDAVGLRRLIESHELVEKYKNRHGGIRFRIRWGQFRHGDTQEYIDRLKQAITDVESCHVD